MKKLSSEAAARVAIDIVNAMGEGVVLIQLDGTISAVNPAVEILTGLKREEVVGKNLRNILPGILAGEDLTRALKALRLVERGTKPQLSLITLRVPDSNPVVISPSITFIESYGEQPITGVLTLKDVTGLHRANELLNQIFNNTHMQIAYLDTQFNFVRVNRAYAGATRHDPEFFIGKNHFELYPHAENERIFRRVLEGGETFFAYEKPFEFPDQPSRGVTFWDWSLRTIEDDDGEKAGLLLCLVDVTERVRAREKLIESEVKYRELVESANSIIMRITPDLRIAFFNEFAQKFYGYEAEEILGRSMIGTIIPRLDSEGHDLKKRAEEITKFPELHGSSEMENVCKDGRRVWIHWSNRAIRDELGRVKEILCVGSDITERKRLEREADAYRRRMRVLADRLTGIAELERRRISTQLHDTVIQTLSLANIRLGSVRKTLETAGLDDICNDVTQTRKLVDMSISECRALLTDLTPPLLYEIGLRPALEDYAEKQEELYGVKIRVQANSQSEPEDAAQKSLLFQSARELVMNALKHAGPCEIHVRLYDEDDDFLLEVRDTGKGFDPEDADPPGTDQEGGFGLFNIRERLQGLGGRLTVASSPGKGTVATIRVPASEVE